MVRSKEHLKSVSETGDTLIQSTLWDLIDSLFDADTFMKGNRPIPFLSKRQHFSKLNVVADEVINTSDGQPSTVADWLRMDAIPVVAGNWYSFRGNAARFDIHGYDSPDIDSGSWISLITKVAIAGGYKIQIPTGVEYISANIAENSGQHGVVDTLAMFDGEEVLDYVAFGYVMDSAEPAGWDFGIEIPEGMTTDEIDAFLRGHGDKFPTFLEPLNMFDKERAVDDEGIQGIDGSFFSLSGWLRTNHIPVLQGQIYATTGSIGSRFNVHAYDEDKVWLSEITVTNLGTHRTFTTPVNAAFVAITLAEVSGNWSKDTFVMLPGNTEPEYNEFRFRLKDDIQGAWVVEAAPVGEVYDQSLNTDDDVEFSSLSVHSLNVTGTLPTGTIASPPTGLEIGDFWADTTDSATHPIIRKKIV